MLACRKSLQACLVKEVGAGRALTLRQGPAAGAKKVLGSAVNLPARRSYTTHSQLPEEHRMVYEMCRNFADSELSPNAGEWDKAHSFPRDAVTKLVRGSRPPSVASHVCRRRLLLLNPFAPTPQLSFARPSSA
jgi:hypothetical protein